MRASGWRRVGVDIGLVKRLRGETKAGVSACRDALEKTSNDYEAAKRLVEGGGLARKGRVTGQGTVAMLVKDHRAAAVEISSVTDFAARTDSVAAAAAACAAALLHVEFPPSLSLDAKNEALLAAAREGGAVALTAAARATGEGIEVRRAAVVGFPPATHVGGYVHSPSGLARVVALVATSGPPPPPPLAQRLAVHVAALAPSSLAELLEQPFGALGAGVGTVGEELKKRGLTLEDFVRLEVGQGVVVEQEDFAQAVKAAMRT